jgi:hypothetical protein
MGSPTQSGMLHASRYRYAPLGLIAACSLSASACHLYIRCSADCRVLQLATKLNTFSGRRTLPMTHPSCDRHKNLQMIPFSLDDASGKISGYICPVPTCDHFFGNRPPEGATQRRILSRVFWAQTGTAACKPDTVSSRVPSASAGVWMSLLP